MPTTGGHANVLAENPFLSFKVFFIFVQGNCPEYSVYAPLALSLVSGGKLI